MTARQVETVAALFAAAAQADTTEIARILHPDFTIEQAQGTPYSGTYHGVDGFIEMFGILTSHFDIAQRNLVFHDTGDGEIGVIVTFDVDFTARATGRRASSGNVELYRFSDNRIARIDVYYKDAAAVADLAVPAERATEPQT